MSLVVLSNEFLVADIKRKVKMTRRSRTMTMMMKIKMEMETCFRLMKSKREELLSSTSPKLTLLQMLRRVHL
jgi:hypothetical protein